MSIEVEVVDVPLIYNLLLSHNCIYAMKSIMSSIFPIICFPFEDQLVTIDDMSIDASNSIASSRSTIPSIDNSHSTTKNVGFGMYTSLMGSFNIETPILDISSIVGNDL